MDMAKPKIRFNGYTEDWEQRKLGDVFEQTSNLVNPKEDEIELWSLTVEDGLTKKSDRYNREFLVKKDDNFKEVRPGDIVYNPMNMTLGAVGYNGMAKSVAVSGYYTTMVAKENYDTYYINTWLKSPQAIRLYRTYATGSLIEKQRVQFPTLSIIPVAFPKYEEQTKIGNYFHFLDNLITLHQRKCEQTKTLKKYMLQKMFPQDGEKVPQIRFEGFTEDWEQRKLGEVVKEGILEAPLDGNHGEKHPTSDEYVESGIPFLMASDIHNGEVNIYSCKYITKERAERLDKGFARNGDVLLTHKATIGETAILSNLMTEYAMLTPQVTYYRIKNEERLNREYLYSFFNSLDFQTELKTKAAQSTRPYIGITAQQNLKIILPSEIDEQRKIGLYFGNLDRLITLHQRKCDELKEVKKFMLQNMFV